MQRRAKVELFERIRRDSRLEGLSIRGLARRHGVHRRLVREALASAVPAERKTPQRTPTALTAAHRAIVRGWLVADRAAPVKQRHTARRVWQRLVDERGARVAGPPCPPTPPGEQLEDDAPGRVTEQTQPLAAAFDEAERRDPEPPRS